MSDHADTYVINERPLTDDTVTFAHDGHELKGGYVARVVFHTFANAWADAEHVKHFRTVDAAERFIVERYGRTWEQLFYSPEHELTDDALTSYVTAALWSSVDGDGNPLDDEHDADDVADETRKTMWEDVNNFLNLIDDEGLIGHADFPDAGQVGHDFWLTRNGHGTGFWDRGLGQLGDDLTKWAKASGECSLYVGDDGKVYID